MEQAKNLNQINDAHEEGDLSQASINTLNKIPDLGQEIQHGLGVPVDQVGSSEVILLSVLVDDSGSMNNNEQAVIDGFNMLLDALQATKQQDNIQVMLRYLNQGLQIPFTPLNQVDKLSTSTFQVAGMTPLFLESATLLGTVISKEKDFADNGIQVRTITLIMTDGDDNASGSTTDSDVAHIVKDMLQSEKHIIATMGFDLPHQTIDFKEVFHRMGIDDKWIYEADATPSEIRKGFQMFSQSAVRASQSAATFSQTAMGGFGDQ